MRFIGAALLTVFLGCNLCRSTSVLRELGGAGESTKAKDKNGCN